MKTLLILIMGISFGCKPKAAFEYDVPSLDTVVPENSISQISKTNDPEINLYKEDFINLASSYNYPLGIKIIYSVKKDLRNLDGHVLGQCITYNDANLIVVDTTFWATASDYNKRSLVFHELGHCMLGRAHRTIYYQGPYIDYGPGIAPFWDYSTHPNWPISLMHRSLVRDTKFQTEYDFYIQELFDEENIYEQSKVTTNSKFNCSFD